MARPPRISPQVDLEELYEKLEQASRTMCIVFENYAQATRRAADAFAAAAAEEHDRKKLMEDRRLDGVENPEPDLPASTNCPSCGSSNPLTRLHIYGGNEYSELCMNPWHQQ